MRRSMLRPRARTTTNTCKLHNRGEVEVWPCTCVAAACCHPTSTVLSHGCKIRNQKPNISSDALVLYNGPSCSCPCWQRQWRGSAHPVVADHGTLTIVFCIACGGMVCSIGCFPQHSFNAAMSVQNVPCRSCKNPPPRCSKSAGPHPPPDPEDILPIDDWPWSEDGAPKETYPHEDYYYSSHKGPGYYPHKPYCSKRGAKYVWVPECAGKEGKTPLGSSCHGAALCQPGNAVTNAEAICTSSGWVVADG